MTDTTTRHASSGLGKGHALCGAADARTTRPNERVNCPDCRVALNHARDRYPAHASYTDWRLTAAQNRAAEQAMVADMYGGADD